MMTDRRKFIGNSSRLLAGAALAAQLPSVMHAGTKSVVPSDKIRIALIGARSMGWGNLENAMKQPGVEVAAICDIDSQILNDRVGEVEKKMGKKPAAYKDFRKLLDDKSIDAVIIGTPDHWHCLTTVYACQAGKDVYVEKPLANSIAECDAIVKATRKYNRVVQVGQQQRSGPYFKEAIDLIKAGKIGKLRKVQVWGNFNYGIGAPVVPDEPVPANVDFDMWLGPAPKRSFNRNRFHGNWRMFWDYGGGLVTDWGVHLLDMALWAKDIKVLPKSVQSAGGNFSFPNNAHETFDTLSVIYQLEDYLITWENVAGTEKGPFGRNYGLCFIGDDASLVINRESWELIPETADGKNKVPAVPGGKGEDSHEAHMINFLECIKSRKDPNCTIENGRLVGLYAHMGNIALRSQSRLAWDGAAGNFGANSAANAFIKPHYRSPWTFPAL